MKLLGTILTYVSAVLALVPFLRPRDRSAVTLLWLPKLLGGALSPILALVSSLGGIVGLFRRDWKMAGAGLLGTGLAVKFMADVPPSQSQFEDAFGFDWHEHMLTMPAGGGTRKTVEFRRNVVVGQKPGSGQPLLADLWLPQAGAARSGIGLIYVHGGGWRIGDKDLGTRYFFRRLARQGHAVLDLSYTLWPAADIATMVCEVNQAILWLRENGSSRGVNPEHIVLMGGSAGAHLALLAAYAPNHPAFRTSPKAAEPTVRGVVAFYPPVDLLDLYTQAKERTTAQPSPLDGAADAIMQSIFLLDNKSHMADGMEKKGEHSTQMQDMIVEMLGGEPDEVPEAYRLLSPIFHAGPHCPPTLLLQGSDDVFNLAPQVRRLHQALKAAGVPAILIEFPHAEHAFDLILPRISPVAQAAAWDVEQFLALMA